MERQRVSGNWRPCEQWQRKGAWNLSYSINAPMGRTILSPPGSSAKQMVCCSWDLVAGRFLVRTSTTWDHCHDPAVMPTELSLELTTPVVSKQPQPQHTHRKWTKWSPLCCSSIGKNTYHRRQTEGVSRKTRWPAWRIARTGTWEKKLKPKRPEQEKDPLKTQLRSWQAGVAVTQWGDPARGCSMMGQVCAHKVTRDRRSETSRQWAAWGRSFWSWLLRRSWGTTSTDWPLGNVRGRRSARVSWMLQGEPGWHASQRPRGRQWRTWAWWHPDSPFGWQPSGNTSGS